MMASDVPFHRTGANVRVPPTDLPIARLTSRTLVRFLPRVPRLRTFRPSLFRARGFVFGLVGSQRNPYDSGRSPSHMVSETSFDQNYSLQTPSGSPFALTAKKARSICPMISSPLESHVHLTSVSRTLGCRSRSNRSPTASTALQPRKLERTRPHACLLRSEDRFQQLHAHFVPPL